MDDIIETTRPGPGTGPVAEVHDITRARMMRLSPVLEETWRYWNSKRSGRDVPAREALEPRAMTLILGHAMILDRIRPGAVRVRLGGRIPDSLMVMETRGLPVRAFFDLTQRGEMADLIERSFTDPASLELDLVSDGEDGRVTAQMLVLPLRDRLGSVTKALSVLVPERIVSDGPRRFRMTRHNLGPIDLPVQRPPVPTVGPARSEAHAPRTGLDAVLHRAQDGGRDGLRNGLRNGEDRTPTPRPAPGRAAPRAPYLRVVK